MCVCKREREGANVISQKGGKGGKVINLAIISEEGGSYHPSFVSTAFAGREDEKWQSLFFSVRMQSAEKEKKEWGKKVPIVVIDC